MLTLHVVSSLDGFIANNNNSISWMDSPDDAYPEGVSESDATRAMKPIDCFVLGSRTYEHAVELGWPYGDTRTVVLTHRELQSTRGTVEFYAGNPASLVRDILAPTCGNIWLVGGAAASQDFLRLGLVDEIRLMVAPVLLGQGLRLFSDSGEETRWHLKYLAAYKNGYVEMVYARGQRPNT